MTTTALERVVRRAADRRAEAAGRCSLCGSTISTAHRHLLDKAQDTLLCVCYACSVLFNRAVASEGHYRLVPERRMRLSGVEPAILGAPVGLAFFVKQDDGSVVAHYPSPAGATRWEADVDAWAAVVESCAALGGMAADVEALLVNSRRRGGGDRGSRGDRSDRQAWLVPIDDCYRLVAIVRTHWRGMYGGDAVWPAIESFFAELRPS